MKFIIIYKFSKNSKVWYMAQNNELPTEELAYKLKDTLQEIHPEHVYQIVNLLHQQNLEVVKNDVQL